MRLFLKVAGVLAIIAVGFWIILYSYNAILGFGAKGNAVVPDLHGKTLDMAKSLVQQAHLNLAIQREEYSPDVPKGGIVNQDPDPGMQVKDGRPIQVVVSEGPQSVSVPDLTGYDYRQAEVLLQNAKLKSGKINFATNSVARENVVVQQNPEAGSTVNGGTAVDLVVSSGPPPSVTMPNLVGNDLDYARSVIKDNSLQMGQIGWRWDENSQAGSVLTQNPLPGAKIGQGNMVSLVVSAGPTEQEQDLPFKQSYITVTLPQFEGEKEVTVWVTDAMTTSQVYSGTHSGGDKIRIMVSSFGDSTVQVKLGDEILSSGKL